jgi:hypothetical protein
LRFGDGDAIHREVRITPQGGDIFRATEFRCTRHRDEYAGFEFGPEILVSQAIAERVNWTPILGESQKDVARGPATITRQFGDEIDLVCMLFPARCVL